MQKQKPQTINTFMWDYENITIILKEKDLYTSMKNQVCLRGVLGFLRRMLGDVIAMNKCETTKAKTVL